MTISRIRILSILLVVISCQSCLYGAEAYIKDNQIYLKFEDGREKRISNDTEPKYNVSLRPDGKKVVFHSEIQRGERPSTHLTVMDVESGRVEKRLPLPERCRKIYRIDWLSHTVLGVLLWNRGISRKYILLNIVNENVIARLWGNEFTLLDEKDKIVFRRGLPGGYIPDPEYKTLEIMFFRMKTKKTSEKTEEDRLNQNARLIYSTKKDVKSGGVYELWSNLFFVNEGSVLIFIEKNKIGTNLVMLKISGLDSSPGAVKKRPLDLEVKKKIRLSFDPDSKELLLEPVRKSYKVDFDFQKTRE